MEKEFVPYELALRMKQLGFDGSCFGYYVDGELRGINLGIEELGGVEPYYQRFGFHTLSNHNIDNQNKIVVTAPTFSQVFRFFRKKYKLHSFIDIYPQPDEPERCWYMIRYFERGKEGKEDYMSGWFINQEKAEPACLKKLIEIIEQKEK